MHLVIVFDVATLVAVYVERLVHSILHFVQSYERYPNKAISIYIIKENRPTVLRGGYMGKSKSMRAWPERVLAIR